MSWAPGRTLDPKTTKSVGTTLTETWECCQCQYGGNIIKNKGCKPAERGPVGECRGKSLCRRDPYNPSIQSRHLACRFCIKKAESGRVEGLIKDVVPKNQVRFSPLWQLVMSRPVLGSEQDAALTEKRREFAYAGRRNLMLGTVLPPIETVDRAQPGQQGQSQNPLPSLSHAIGSAPSVSQHNYTRRDEIGMNSAFWQRLPPGASSRPSFLAAAETNRQGFPDIPGQLPLPPPPPLRAIGGRGGSERLRYSAPSVGRASSSTSSNSGLMPPSTRASQSQGSQGAPFSSPLPPINIGGRNRSEIMRYSIPSAPSARRGDPNTSSNSGFMPPSTSAEQTRSSQRPSFSFPPRTQPPGDHSKRF